MARGALAQHRQQQRKGKRCQYEREKHRAGIFGVWKMDAK